MFAVSAHVDHEKPPTVDALASDFALVFSSFGAKSIISYHGISAGTIGAGKPIDPAVCCEILSSHVNGASIDGWVDHSVIYRSAELFVFTTPKGKPETLWFRLDGTKSHKLEVKLPTLIYVFNRISEQLHIFASVTDRVTADTALYDAPFCNIYTGGKLCLGSTTLPAGGSSEATIKDGVREALFNSLFTHITGVRGFRDVVTTEEHIEKWKQFATKPPRAKDLKKTGKTLSQFISQGAPL